LLSLYYYSRSLERKAVNRDYNFQYSRKDTAVGDTFVGDAVVDDETAEVMSVKKAAIINTQ
jgi:hypothetical protein